MFFELSLNFVDLDKSTEVRFGLNHWGLWCFNSYTPFSLMHPPDIYKRKWIWASSGPLALLLTPPCNFNIHPLVGVLRQWLGSRSPFSLLLSIPPVVDLLAEFTKPVLGLSGSPSTWLLIHTPSFFDLLVEQKNCIGLILQPINQVLFYTPIFKSYPILIAFFHLFS